MKITKLTAPNGTIYIATISISERNLVTAAGFHFDDKTNRWWTRNKAHAAQLSDYADASCRDELTATPAQKMKVVADAIAQMQESNRFRRYRHLKLSTGAVIVRGTESMLLEDGTEVPAENVTSLYRMSHALNEKDIPASIQQHGTLIAQCLTTDWNLAVQALTTEDNREETI